MGALAAAPVFAREQDGAQRRRSGSERRGEQATGDARQGRDRAVPRRRDPEPRGNVQRQNESPRPYESPRQYQTQRQNDQRQYQPQRQYRAERQYDQRQYQAQRQYDARRDYQGPRQYDARRDYQGPRQYDGRRDYGRRAVPRPYYSNRGYGSRTVIVPRYIRPRIVTIVPYRPYVYRPRFGMGVYYGSGGSYPYGYTPRGYYDPIPGRIYGGLRIVDAPREAQVFADGYYIGIVNDFDGVFQHANLEAGTHRILIEAPGLEPVEFDVMIQPGRTITFRAEMY
jgi:hypothetical protein